MKSLIEEREELKAQLWGSFLLFVQTFFPLVTGRQFHVSSPPGRESHFITIAKELTLVARMQLDSLLINVAPGSGKSVLVSMWVAWTMSRWPNSQYLYISYGHELASKHTEFIRRIIQNSHYKRLFGVEVRSDSKAKDFFQTTAGGAVKAFGSAGSITGNDAGLPNCDHFSGAAICDDLIKPDRPGPWLPTRKPLTIADPMPNRSIRFPMSRRTDDPVIRPTLQPFVSEFWITIEKRYYSVCADPMCP